MEVNVCNASKIRSQNNQHFSQNHYASELIPPLVGMPTWMLVPYPADIAGTNQHSNIRPPNLNHSSSRNNGISSASYFRRNGKIGSANKNKGNRFGDVQQSSNEAKNGSVWNSGQQSTTENNGSCYGGGGGMVHLPAVILPRLIHPIPRIYSPSHPPISRLPSNEPLDKLSNAIWEKYFLHQQKLIVYKEKISFRNKLELKLREYFPESELHLVGSSITGFGCSNSDMDLCFLLTHREVGPRTDAAMMLRNISAILTHEGLACEMNTILAKVPILRFKEYNGNILVDLNIGSTVGVRNSHLLYYYSQLDERVGALVLIVKLWARHHDINNASEQTLSSYSLVLMVIHYLQCGMNPAFLPSLQALYPLAFSSHQKLACINYCHTFPKVTSHKHASLGELLLGFLDYYTNRFDFKNVISVRNGSIVDKNQMASILGHNFCSHNWKHISIEEPYDYSNAAKAVYCDVAFARIQNAFRTSYEVLNQTKHLNSIFEKKK